MQNRITHVVNHLGEPVPVKDYPRFRVGDRVRKVRGSSWQGRVVGTYSTELTFEGYCVESEREPGSVQIYPVSALEAVSEQAVSE